MSGILLSVLLMASGQPPAATETPTTTPAVAAPAPTAEPKMVCKYEYETGSRVKKVKVCRPEGAKPDEQTTALQRQLSKNGDFVEAPSTFGN